MSHHIERMVKGCDRRDCADRFALRENLAAFAMGGQITGKNLSIILNCKLTCQRENIVRTTCFIKRMLFADAQFKCQPMGNFLAPCADQFSRAKQNLLAFISC